MLTEGVVRKEGKKNNVKDIIRKEMVNGKKGKAVRELNQHKRILKESE